MKHFKKNILICLLFLCVITLLFLTACNKTTVGYQELLILKTDVTSISLIEGEDNLSKINFEYVDSFGNVKQLTASELNISQKDEESLKQPGFKTITLKYNNAEHIISFLIKERPRIFTYDLTFNANGGYFPNSNVEILNLTSNETLYSPPETPIREGYKFSGWYPNEYFVESEKLITPYKIDLNLTAFIAKWLSTKEHLVSYKKQMNDDDNFLAPELNIPQIEDFKISDNERIMVLKVIDFKSYDVLPLSDYLRYDFIGYKLKERKEFESTWVETTLESNHSAPILITGETIITLLFKIKKYKVKFTVKEGNQELIFQEFSVNYGNEVNESELNQKPSIEGYTTSWYNLTANKNFELNDIKNITRNITIELQSKVIKIEVNFYDDNNKKLPNISAIYSYNEVVGVNKSIPEKTGHEGRWKAGFDDNTYYTSNQLEQLALNVGLFSNIQESKQINFYASYTRKKYKLRFNYKLPEYNELLNCEKEIEYGQRINAREFMDSNLFALTYKHQGILMHGYDRSLYNKSTWHYSEDTSNISTIVQDQDIFDVDNKKIKAETWNESELGENEYNFHFKPVKHFNHENIQFAYLLPPDNVPTKAKNDEIMISFINEQVNITNTAGLTRLFPRKSVSGWEYNVLVNDDSEEIIYQLFDKTYTYYNNDVIFYNNEFYKLSENESQGLSPEENDNWVLLQSIATEKRTISTEDIRNINLTRTHIFHENPLVDGSIYPIFEDRKFSLTLFNQSFSEDPTASEGKYVYKYEFNNVYQYSEYAYDHEINLSDLYNQFITDNMNYENGSTGDFQFLGFYENELFSSISYDKNDTIEIKRDMELYAKWIDNNFGSEGLVYQINDEMSSSVVGFEPNISDLTNKATLSIIIPDNWEGRSIKTIKDGAFNNLIKYSNVVVEKLHLPKELNTIENNELKKLKISDAISIDSSNTIYSVTNNILYKNEDTLKTIVKVPFNIALTNLQLVFDEVFRVSSFAFSNFSNEFNLDTIQYANLKIIDEYAFIGSNITGLNIGSNISKIGTKAFAYCDKLTNISCDNFAEKIEVGKDAFSKTPWLNSQRTIGKNIVLGNVLIEYKIVNTDIKIDINNDVFAIADNAFTFENQLGESFSDISISFGTQSNLMYVGSNIFSGNIKKLIIENDNDIIFNPSSLNNVESLQVKPERKLYFENVKSTLDNKDIKINDN